MNKKDSQQQLSKEILGLFAATALIAVFFHLFMSSTANAMILAYIEESTMEISVYEIADIKLGIQSISICFSAVLFVILFLFLIGERLAYITEIIKGIEALGRHEWQYEIPLQGNNELTELAERVNAFSKEEQAFQEKEQQLQEEKAGLIRALSHDIRTPLTSILSYSEYMKNKAVLEQNEMIEYITLMEQKAQQIKVLTDRLLDGGSRQLEFIENGRFFMEQLLYEWEAELENDFTCQMDCSACPDFSGEFDVQELRRILDNLSSNIRKYADAGKPISMRVMEKDGHVCLCQSNYCKRLEIPVESTRIGIESMRKIAAHYGGNVEVFRNEEVFSIQITL